MPRTNIGALMSKLPLTNCHKLVHARNYTLSGGSHQSTRSKLAAYFEIVQSNSQEPSTIITYSSSSSSSFDGLLRASFFITHRFRISVYLKRRSMCLQPKTTIMKSRQPSFRWLARQAPAVVVIPVLMPRYSGLRSSLWVLLQLYYFIYPSKLSAVPE